MLWKRTKKSCMKKLLIKWLMPSAEQMTDVAVDTIAKFVNSSSKADTIAKYSSYANELVKV